ncbi:helix-hairpin-helix domain-containing protein [Conexibacter stalactiti]|uniref:Helix-hairpin-helix domain-containing protein n=1 Tax=Conexibacter stalactiti TaxID=1940611 RepID=A0ABU4HJJ5_9ACTN|nr:helix-hairpin-helix domain-containing protein [Conexibacter stalactiti]MDW5593483.1 helix-hairpin-helix domain-containing protein [Conexibacter stalactiti]MEC5034124.1 helix-hairpin-helix domain-containing protein [Conexibacter stalactiti]
MPQPTKPQLAIYAACAIAVLLIGARFLRAGEAGAPGGSASADTALAGGALGAPDGASGGLADPAGGGSASASASASASDELAAGAVVVDVKGAVRRPGVYRLATGARVLDAVERAGGLSHRADRRGVNLAARVTDGGEVIVPRRGERAVGGVGVTGSAGGAAAGGAAAGVAGGSTAGAAGAGAGTPLALDINTATAQELELLDGVGPATAAKIIAYREQAGGFRSIEELDAVSGIGEAKLAAIRAQLGR